MNTITNRIERIQNAHPWMLEREARWILVCTYAALTNALGLRGEELQEEMDRTTDSTCSTTRTKLEVLLKETGCPDED